VTSGRRRPPPDGGRDQHDQGIWGLTDPTWPLREV